MKRLFFTVVVALSAIACFAGEPQGGIFKHVGLGVSGGTNGISVELSSPVTRWVQVRAGLSFMPNFKLNTDADVEYSAYGYTKDTTIDLEGAFGRTQGSLIVNLYPLPWGSFYVAGGLYFGGNKLLKVKGHSDELEGVQNAGVEIGDYTLPVDDHGNVKGGLKVNNVRPYIGIGWGRAVPNNRVNFGIELGLQFHGTPKLYTEHGDITELTKQLGDEGDNDVQKIMDKVKVWPVLTFKISGRIF